MINNTPIIPKEILTILKKDIYNMIKEVKLSICLICERDNKNNIGFLVLTCNCFLCNKICISKYFSVILEKIINKKQSGILIFDKFQN